VSDLEPGSEFAGHRIEEVVGHGGMGVVYRAVHVALGRTVALKILAPELAGNDEFQTRFRQESKLAASIDHPNVIPIFDAGEEGDSLYVTMRFVAGTDLRHLAAGNGLTPERAVRIVAQAAEALDAAHARGLVHRDVKPGNVLIEARDGHDHAFLTDFGLTKQVTSDPSITETGNWLGTVDYAAPEQIRARPLDRRADVYALGGVLYWALTGRVPYPREGDMAKMYAHLNDPPPALGDSIPAELAAVVGRAMAKEPADRYQAAGDLGRAVLAAAPAAPSAAPRAEGAPRAEASTRSLPVAPPPAPAVRPAPPSAVRSAQTRRLSVPRARRNRIAALAALGVGALLLILAIAGAFSGGGGGSGSSRHAKAAPAASARTPTNAEVGRFLQRYADRYHAEDAAGLGALFTPDAVRRNGSTPPQGRAAAIADYRNQFARLTSPPSYRLSGLRMSSRPGEVTVTGRYRISSDTGTTTGRITFGLVERGTRLLIRRLDITPD
jgi:ketosteroid isomerase-like protein